MSQGKRTDKYGKQIQKDLASVFQKNPRHFFGNSLVTITGVDMSPDLGVAKVHFSVLPITQAEEVLDGLNAKKSEIRKLLGRMIGKQVRIIPELIFYHDDTAENASKMDQLIDGLDIPAQASEEEE